MGHSSLLHRWYLPHRRLLQPVTLPLLPLLPPRQPLSRAQKLRVSEIGIDLSSRYLDLQEGVREEGQKNWKVRGPKEPELRMKKKKKSSLLRPLFQWFLLPHLFPLLSLPLLLT